MSKLDLIVAKQFATERYILSTLPRLYIPLWKRDSGSSGGSFLSDDGHGYRCTVTGALLSQQGRIFDGTDDYINCEADSLLNITDTLTLECWVKVTTNDGYLLCMPESVAWGTPFRSYSIYQGSDDRLTYSLNTDGVARSATGTIGDFTAGVFRHLVLRIASGAQSLTVDGVSYKTSTFTYTAIQYTGSPKLTIGTRNADALGEYGKATIGEIRLYNRILGQIEAEQNRIMTRWRYQ